VYVVKPDMIAELRAVTVERTEGEQAVVKGIARDERVVTRGALRLAPGARVEIRSESEAPS
jgi:multidrug efflux system membrane fusion protein